MAGAAGLGQRVDLWDEVFNSSAEAFSYALAQIASVCGDEYAGGKVWALGGDPRQIPPVAIDGDHEKHSVISTGHLENFETWRLVKIMRQKDPRVVKATMNLAVQKFGETQKQRRREEHVANVILPEFFEHVTAPEEKFLVAHREAGDEGTAKGDLVALRHSVGERAMDYFGKTPFSVDFLEKHWNWFGNAREVWWE